MRELKFRAWNKEKEIMVYEDEDNSADYWDGIHASDVELVNYRLQRDEEYIWLQYTGLSDKNGRWIYEGDVRENLFGKTFIVVYENELASFIGEYIEGGFDYLADCGADSILLGTKYENPDLLEVSK